MILIANTTNPTNCPLAVDLFAGVGGLSLGMEAAGFEVTVAVEKDDKTAACYQQNFPHTQVLCTDVSQLEAKTIIEAIYTKYPGWNGQLAAVVGGPPCQGFSRIGKREPNDPRNKQVSQFVRLVAELRPLTFVMENVVGLRDSRYAELINSCYRQLQDGGYIVSEWKLNAANYGISQERTRLFWVGSLHGEIPIPTPQQTSATVKDAIADLMVLEPHLGFERDAVAIPTDPKASKYTRSLDLVFQRTGREHPNLLTGCTLTNHSESVRKRFLTTATGQLEPISRLYRLDWEGFCSTLRAGTASDRGGHTAARPIHPEFPRVITVREAARLSSFPDWFQFDPTKWRGYRQVGNAVPPLLAYAVGKQILTTALFNLFQQQPAEGQTLSSSLVA